MPRHIRPLLLLLLLLHTPASIYGSSSRNSNSSSSSSTDVSLSLVKASTRLEGKGFHRVFESRILLQQQPSARTAASAAAGEKDAAEECLLSLEYRLPQQLFADPDQTYELGAPDRHGRVISTGAPGGPLLLQATTIFKPSCQGGPRRAPQGGSCMQGPVMVDVELPSYSPRLGPPPVVRQEVHIHPKMLEGGAPGSTHEVMVQLPVHLRYGAPCSSSSCNGLLREAAAAPLVGLSCRGREKQQQTATAAPAAAAAAARGAAAEAAAVEFFVPVGQTAHWGLSAAVTAAAMTFSIIAVVFALAA